MARIRVQPGLPHHQEVESVQFLRCSFKPLVIVRTSFAPGRQAHHQASSRDKFDFHRSLEIQKLSETMDDSSRTPARAEACERDELVPI
jgi:hypothetical protein